AARPEAIVIAVGREAPAIATPPELEVRLPCAPLQIHAERGARSAERLCASRSALCAPRCPVRLPEPQAIRPAGAKNEPTIENDEVCSAGGPLERQAEPYDVQINQV